MATPIYAENFLTIKKIYGRTTIRRKDTLDVAPPASKDELAYQSMLSEANQSYFNREYTIALERYLDLQNRILVQSHPEMPALPGGGGWRLGIDITKVQIDPLFELSRKYLEKVDPSAPIINPLKVTHINQVGDFAVNESLSRFRNVGLELNVKNNGLNTANILNQGRANILAGNFEEGLKSYTQLQGTALQQNDNKEAAQIAAEAGALLATYAEQLPDTADRTKWMNVAKQQLTTAATLYRSAGDTNAQNMITTNMRNIEDGLNIKKAAHGNGAADAAIAIAPAPVIAPALAKAHTTYLLPDKTNTWIAATDLIKTAAVTAPNTQLGLLSDEGVKTVALTKGKYQASIADVYKARISATTLAGLDFFEDIESNFVAYIPHLFFYILPISIGDTYLAMGMYSNAEAQYIAASKYTFINHGIEAPALWQKIAQVSLRWGNELFRQENIADAKAKFEKIVTSAPAVPASVLYQGSLSVMNAQVAEAVKQLQGQPHAAINPKVSQIIMQVWQQLQKIQSGLNFLGLSDDYAPIFRYKYLQAAATYMADQAIQTERTFINFRVAGENQKFERIQLQGNLELQQSALRIEQKRLEDAALEVAYANATRDYSDLMQSDAQDALDEWNTTGRELSSVNAALSWASNAANDQDITYTGVRYNGESHDYSGDVEDFYDTVGEIREDLNWEMQRNRLDRQLAEAGAEVALAAVRQQQAVVRQQIQQMTVDMAGIRVQGAQELLDYSKDRMFDEDMWFQLSNELQDLARNYLDNAIYVAFLMERAYELEFDRSLNRIRLDYGIGGSTDQMLGGDYLKRDIDSFTIDYLQYAQKKNPVRLTISLSEQFPSAFNQFLTTGKLNFRTDLEIFDRLFPGTYRRKLKKIEVFVEGLIPLEGATGYLTHLGVSTEWRQAGAGWTKFNRITPVEEMVLSSYQFRRDISVFQPSDQMLGQFENLALQSNWTLEIPRSSNNLDYNAISDIKVAFYFDADYNAGLRTFLGTFYTNTGGHSVIYSARFQFPDQYFRLDTDRKLSFDLGATRFAYNYTSLSVDGFGIRLLDKNGGPVANQPISIVRETDHSIVTGTTDATGLLLGDAATMAPFADWKGDSPVDTYTVQFPDGMDTTTVGDVQLFLDYGFTYRADA